jgi:hypothetical protein
MPKKRKCENPFVGVWRIVSMSAWDDEFLNEESLAYIEFDNRLGGQFHFAYVHGHMDCRLGERDGKQVIEWTWEGNDEMDSAQGRGWAVQAGTDLHGMIFFHQGDDSEFVAARVKSRKQSKKKRP